MRRGKGGLLGPAVGSVESTPLRGRRLLSWAAGTRTEVAARRQLEGTLLWREAITTGEFPLEARIAYVLAPSRGSFRSRVARCP